MKIKDVKKETKYMTTQSGEERRKSINRTLLEQKMIIIFLLLYIIGFIIVGLIIKLIK